MPSKRIKVAIVGGGIGGLSAANAMFRRGIDVTIWEQSDSLLGESGTGLGLFPNGRRQLEGVELGEALTEVGAKIGDRSIPEYSGSRAYRGLVLREKIPEWPQETHQVWMGDGEHFMVYPVRSDRLFNYVGFVPTSDETIESWSTTGDRDDLAASFEGWDPCVVGFLEKVETCFWWGCTIEGPWLHGPRGGLHC
jgi:2-polyprenyl-6-methoxyphenol hydroxylase-like FAD-dependent oxidoreductase